jgi:hypothetical protein
LLWRSSSSPPLTILEAMAFGLPVAATDVFGVAEVINDGDNGWLFPARDVAAVIGTLHRVLAMSAEERRIVGAAGRRTIVGGYGLQARAGEYGKLIGSVLGVRHGRALQPVDGQHDTPSTPSATTTTSCPSSKGLRPPSKRRRSE